MQKNRNGAVVSGGDSSQERMLGFLYGTGLGRAILKPLTAPVISKIAGAFLSTGLSRLLIGPFIRKNSIDMSQFEQGPFKSYNEFFSRKILPGKRPIDPLPDHLISPCDSKLTVLPITEDAHFTVKRRSYSAASLLKDESLAKEYVGGQLLILRLTVDDYHRYHWFCDGTPGAPVTVPGVLHTVNPIANDHYPIYHENCREYTTLRTETFGDVIMMEVGALLVGKIVNAPYPARVSRGDEKGYFQFGGSTVILLFKAGTVKIDDDIVKNSADGIETVVKLGEKIGIAV